MVSTHLSVVYLNPLESTFLTNNENKREIDIWITYKGRDYKTYQEFGSIANMNKGKSFSVECSTESIGHESDLDLFLQCFEEYNQSDKIKILKQELSKIKVCLKVDEQEVIELSVTSKKRGIYTEIPMSIKNILSIDF